MAFVPKAAASGRANGMRHSKGYKMSGEMDDNYDWSAFTVSMFIDAPPERCLEPWTSPAGMERFFIREASHVDAGGTHLEKEDAYVEGGGYLWHWWHPSSSSGKIVSVRRDAISFSFGDCLVDVLARPYQSGTLLQIRQQQIATDERSQVSVHLNCRGGWTYFATTLKAWLEHGVDVRDKNPETAGSLAVGWTLAESTSE